MRATYENDAQEGPKRSKKRGAINANVALRARFLWMCEEIVTMAEAQGHVNSTDR